MRLLDLGGENAGKHACALNSALTLVRSLEIRRDSFTWRDEGTLVDGGQRTGCIIALTHTVLTFRHLP